MLLNWDIWIGNVAKAVIILLADNPDSCYPPD